MLLVNHLAHQTRTVQIGDLNKRRQRSQEARTVAGFWD